MLCNKKWLPVTVSQQVAPKSYDVVVNGTHYRRNRTHLRETKEDFGQRLQENIPSNIPEITTEDKQIDVSLQTQEVNETIDNGSTSERRSKQVSKMPKYLSENFVLK
jgi:hypothetical protein